MYKERVVIKTIAVVLQGQITNFQVKIPREAERIIGVEVSASFTESMLPSGGSGLGISRPIAINVFTKLQTQFLGTLRLQSFENTNVMFTEDVCGDDPGLAFGDVTALSSGLFPQPATHGLKREEFIVNTNGSTTILKGVYRDGISGTLPSGDLSLGGSSPGGPVKHLPPPFVPYNVNVYVWYELQNKKP